MADTIRVHTGGQDPTFHNPPDNNPPNAEHRHHTPEDQAALSHVYSLDDAPPRTPWTASLLVVLICELGLLTSVRAGWDTNDDGVGVVPLIALAAIALAAIRWRPDVHAPPARSVSLRLAIGVFVASAALVAYLVTQNEPDVWLGPMLTLALGATYLAMWGFRSLALLRSMMLLSLLTWPPIASSVHDIVRSTLDQPSALIYQRLATLPLFGVDDEPWRLFTASLHRGSVVVIATIALAIAASRLRLSMSVVVDLVVTVALALVVHHIVILASPIDAYDPEDVAQVATNPTIEIGISIVAVLMLIIVRQRRNGDETTPTAATQPIAVDRDPVIFQPTASAPQFVIATLLLAAITPLVVLAMLTANA